MQSPQNDSGEHPQSTAPDRNTKTGDIVLGASVVEGPAILPVTGENSEPVKVFDDEWLRDFYKECGREVTLAYTTLNQMKNWAIVVTTAVIAAIVSLGRDLQHGGGDSQIVLATVTAAGIAYLFTLRFFVRAILCYINLSRWNTLQSKIIELKLIPFCSANGLRRSLSEQDLKKIVEDYYVKWLSPIDRKSQITSNLKLGFGLLFSIPIAF